MWPAIPDAECPVAVTNRTSASKFLSLLLRHDPGAIGLALDDEGWAVIEDIVRLSAGSRTPFTRALIEEITATSDKRRFLISPDGQRIRANQGHSIPVDLGLTPKEPPATLYHGTARRHLESIMQEGLLKGARQHVHLSSDPVTARRVGARHGDPVVLRVHSGRMSSKGFKFYRSENGVWLTEFVSPEFFEPEA